MSCVMMLKYVSCMLCRMLWVCMQSVMKHGMLCLHELGMTRCVRCWIDVYGKCMCKERTIDACKELESWMLDIMIYWDKMIDISAWSLNKEMYDDMKVMG